MRDLLGKHILVYTICLQVLLVRSARGNYSRTDTAAPPTNSMVEAMRLRAAEREQAAQDAEAQKNQPEADKAREERNQALAQAKAAQDALDALRKRMEQLTADDSGKGGGKGGDSPPPMQPKKEEEKKSDDKKEEAKKPEQTPTPFQAPKLTLDTVSNSQGEAMNSISKKLETATKTAQAESEKNRTEASLRKAKFESELASIQAQSQKSASLAAAGIQRIAAQASANKLPPRAALLSSARGFLSRTDSERAGKSSRARGIDDIARERMASWNQKHARAFLEAERRVRAKSRHTPTKLSPQEVP